MSAGADGAGPSRGVPEASICFSGGHSVDAREVTDTYWRLLTAFESFALPAQAGEPSDAHLPAVAAP